MNKEKLDTLLRSKLQWHESEVQEAELDAVFNAMGMKKKRKSLLPYLSVAAIILAVTVSLIFYTNDELNTDLKLKAIEKPKHEQNSAIGQTENKSLNKGNDESQMAPVSGHQNNLLSLNDKQVRAYHPGELKNNNPRRNTGIKDTESGISNPAAEIRESVNLSGQMYAGDFSEIYEESSHSSIAGYSRMQVNSKDEDKLNGPASSKIEHSLLKSKNRFKKILDLLGPELGFWIAPTVNFETVSVNAGSEDKVHVNYINQKSKFEKPLFTVNTGLEFQMRFLPFLNFSTGIAYFRSGNSYNYNYTLNRIPVIDSASGRILAYITLPDSSSSRVMSKGRHVISYVEIPLRLRFTVFNLPSCKVGIEPAYTMQFMNSEKGEQMDPVSLQLFERKSYKSFNGNFQLALPVSFKLKNKFGFTIAPFAGRSAQNVLQSDMQSKQRVYAGVRLTLNYRL